MKHIISLIALIALCFNAGAQSIQWTPQPGTKYTNTMAAKTSTYDTLKGVDTTYSYWSFSQPVRLSFVVTTIQTDDSLSGTLYLQATNDNSNWLARNTTAGYWESITGLTSLCTTCAGASKTYTLATGTTKTTFDVGLTDFKYWRAFVTSSRTTDTTAVNAVAYWGY